MIYELFEPIFQFIDRGGFVLYFIMALLVVLWALLINKFLILGSEFPQQQANVINQWNERIDHRSWFSRKIKIMLLADLFRKLDSNVAMIKTLIALCPLFGLLGTVSGMIEVFEVMATLGNSSPRAMASGISKATIPTMAGMVAALTGLLAFNILNKIIEDKKHKAQALLFNRQEAHT